MSDVPLKVLYVDDEKDILDIARLSLEKIGGMKVICTLDASQARDFILEHKPDIILLDMMMPKIDGLTLLKQLQEQQLVTDTPVVFVTARIQERNIKDYIAKGATGVIVKPFDPMLLSGQVKSLFESDREEVKANSTLTDSLDSIRKTYVAGLSERIKILQEFRSRLITEEEDNSQFVQAATCVHKLAGSGTTFGYPNISNIAHELEVILTSEETTMFDKKVQLIDDLIDECRQAKNS